MISRLATVIPFVFLLAAASLSCNGAAEDAMLPSRTIETQALPSPTQITKSTQRPEPMQLPQPQQRIWPNVASRSVSFRFVDPPPLDWQILDSDVIVVANFVSATAGVDTYEGPPPAYLPMHTLQFRASQYLKGTGPTEFTVEVLDYGPHTPLSGYLNRDYVLDLARSSLEARNIQWDSRTGVLFLNGTSSRRE